MEPKSIAERDLFNMINKKIRYKNQGLYQECILGVKVLSCDNIDYYKIYFNEDCTKGAVRPAGDLYYADITK